MGFANNARMERGPDGSLFIRAPAKINLFLHVTGQRSDGYHLLESLFVFTKRGDLVKINEAATFSFSVSGSFASSFDQTVPSDNLVVLAAHKLAAYAGVDCHAHIELEKNLPVASGLGGGSADAAATLIGLNALWNLDIDDQTLLSLALELGADVPACLHSQPLLARGIGEKISPISLPWSAGIVVVNPRVPISTPEVFKGFKAYRERRGLPVFDISVLDYRKLAKDINSLHLLTSNSLEDPAKGLCSKIVDVERYLRHNSQAEFIRMTGSGASVVALYHDREAAAAVATRVRDENPDWWVMADEIA